MFGVYVNFKMRTLMWSAVQVCGEMELGKGGGERQLLWSTVTQDIHIRLTRSLPQPVKFTSWKVHTYAPQNSIFDSPITNLLSLLTILIEFLSRAHVKVGTFIVFPSDGAANMAVKGLKSST